MNQGKQKKKSNEVDKVNVMCGTVARKKLTVDKYSCNTGTRR